MSTGAITTWYEKLTPRDQRILRFGTVAVTLIVVAGILIPLQHSLTQARDRLSQQQQDLEWMKRQTPVLVAAGPGQAANGGGRRESPVVLIDRSARESGLGKAITGTTQPASDGAMRVQFANADFNLFLGWLHRLSTQQGMRIEETSITASGSPGVVNVSVQLRPGA